MVKRFPRLKTKAVLSPMAGVTDVAFRALAKRYGAAMTYTEFVSSRALVEGSEKTMEMTRTDPIEKPVACQLFGANVEDVIEAGKLMQKNFDVIDINCGCPAWKVIKTGAGSALLNDTKKIASFVEKLTDALDVPVSVKIRAGIDKNHINAVEVAQAVESAGGAAIAVHGRTQKQGYRGEADWEVIRKVKDSVSIPVIGNGDVFDPETFDRRIEETGVDLIMIARGAMGDPGLFARIKDGERARIPKLEQFRAYLELTKKYEIRFASIKEHAMNFTKGLKGASKARGAMMHAKTIEDLWRIVATCQE